MIIKQEIHCFGGAYTLLHVVRLLYGVRLKHGRIMVFNLI